MKSKFAFFMALFLCGGLVAFARGAQKAEAGSEEASGIRAGTKFSAELESNVDAKTAKPGDEVSARITQNVKEKGKVVIRKGDHLKGRITEAQSAASNGGSHIAIAFDSLVRGDSTTSFNAVIHSVLSTPAEERAREAEMAEPGPMAGAGGGTRARSSAGGGGMMGGVAPTVGATAGAVTGVAGNATGGVTGAAAGGVAGGLATPARGIQINTQAQAGAQVGSSSVLSTRRGDLKLESGTRLQFQVQGRGHVETK